MYTSRVTRVENKNTRRKFAQKIQTLAKKSVELSTEHNCDILLIIYSEHNRRWIQYCNTDSDTLFFRLQSAKDHLETIEKYDNTNYLRLLTSIPSVENSTSPKPSKHFKANENDSFSTQPIKIVEDLKNTFKSSESTLSTVCTLPKIPELVPPKIKEGSELTSDFFPLAKPKVECDSSSDFDFESYFVSDNNT